MSHVVLIKARILNLDALAKALEHFQGAKLIRGQTRYRWYGRHAGDYPLPEGIKLEDLGTCDHAIHVDGVNYEVGLKNVDGTGYQLLYDFYGAGHFGGHDGLKLKALFGDQLGQLTHQYKSAVLELELQNAGFATLQRHVEPDGTIVLTAED